MDRTAATADDVNMMFINAQSGDWDNVARMAMRYTPEFVLHATENLGPLEDVFNEFRQYLTILDRFTDQGIEVPPMVDKDGKTYLHQVGRSKLKRFLGKKTTQPTPLSEANKAIMRALNYSDEWVLPPTSQDARLASLRSQSSTQTTTIGLDLEPVLDEMKELVSSDWQVKDTHGNHEWLSKFARQFESTSSGWTDMWRNVFNYLYHY